MSIESEQLKKDGELVELRYETGEVKNSATGEISVPGISNIIHAYGYTGQYRRHFIDGESIIASDIRLVLEKIAIKPKAGWLCTVDSIEYKIINVQAIRRAGVDIIYICQLRA